MCAPSVPDARGDGVQWNDSWTASLASGSGSRASLSRTQRTATATVCDVDVDITRGFDWGPGRATTAQHAGGGVAVLDALTETESAYRYWPFVAAL